MSGDAALLDLLGLLKAAHYRFTAVTPATHAHVLERRCPRPDLRDIFGWNRPFEHHDLNPDLLNCLDCGSALDRDGGTLRSRVRVASLGHDLFLHSEYPTLAPDAVFFGPDTYRFARFVSEQIPVLPKAPKSVVDMGAGSGAGGIVAAHLIPGAHVRAVDVNLRALKYAAINAEAASVELEPVQSSELPAGADLVIANPPYIMDTGRRAYRDGGELYGGQVARDWTRQALETMASNGTMLLYSGAAFVNGHSPLIDALRSACTEAGADLHLEETDPDVFGEELAEPAYAKVERIAVICATIRKA